MAAPLYRAPPASACAAVALDGLTVLYHRSSGTTHLLAEPSPQLLAMLADTPMTAAALRERLAAIYDLPDVSDEALEARLAELVAAGLVAIA